MKSMLRAWISKKSQEIAVKQGYHFKRNSVKSFRGLKNISGLQCIVKADYINGQITGSLSSNRSNKQNNFTFNPIKYRRTPSLQNEINRLYFDAVEDKKCIKGAAARRVTLLVVNEDQYLDDYDLQREYF